MPERSPEGHACVAAVSRAFRVGKAWALAPLRLRLSVRLLHPGFKDGGVLRVTVPGSSSPALPHSRTHFAVSGGLRAVL